MCNIIVVSSADSEDAKKIEGFAELTETESPPAVPEILPNVCIGKIQDIFLFESYILPKGYVRFYKDVE